jgi:hypothetical protein
MECAISIAIQQEYFLTYDRYSGNQVCSGPLQSHDTNIRKMRFANWGITRVVDDNPWAFSIQRRCLC